MSLSPNSSDFSKTEEDKRDDRNKEHRAADIALDGFRQYMRQRWRVCCIFLAQVWQRIWRRPTYRYRRLPSAAHTRLLVLHPSLEPQAPLRCTLSTTRLEGSASFEAVSYVCGSDETVGRVICDGKVLHVTANLQNVLRCLRKSHHGRTLWADALCINQDDTTERADQVAVMGNIYSASQRTIIWLGDDSGNDGEAVASLLEEIVQRIVSQGGNLEDSRFVPQLHPSDPLSGDARWASYRIMVGHSWFSRVWTVQEAALGKDPCILWGTTEIPWKQVIGVNQWLLSKARHVWYYLKPWLNDVHGRGFWLPIWPMPDYIEVLARAKTLHCSDDHDRIFAFLGSPKARVGDSNEAIVRPNYDKSVRAVYTDFAVAWLTQTHDLRLLSAVEHTPATLNDVETPSWVPQWNVTLSSNFFGLYSPPFHASKGLEARIAELTASRELRLKGVMFHVVEWVSSQLPEDIRVVDSGKDEPGANQHAVHERSVDGLVAIWTYLARPSSKFSHKGISRLLALTRSLCRQSYGNDLRKPHPDEAAFALHLARASSCFGDTDESTLEDLAQGGNARDFVTHAGIWAGLRSVALTGDGHYTLVPAVTEPGDQVFYIGGMLVPVVLRKLEGLNRYCFVGETYVLDMMNGEICDSQPKSQDIVVI
jgi:hypothetical protein